MNISKLLGWMLVGKGAHITYAIRFIPNSRTRTDLRGRLYGSYLTAGEMRDALDDIKNGGPIEEKEDGIYYASVEICTSPFGRRGDAKPKGDPRQIPLPHLGPEVGPEVNGSGLPTGLPEPATLGPATADAAQVAHDERGAGGADGTLHGPAAGQDAAAGPAEPVGYGVTATGKVSLDQIGMR